MRSAKSGCERRCTKAPKFGLDTSCLIPLLASWDQRHAATIAAYEARRRAGERLVIATHSLLECFSVLTRLPAPLRITPQEARLRLAGNFAHHAELAGPGPAEHWALLERMAFQGVAGGRVYDAIIAAAAFQAGATLLLTWNVRDLLTVAPPGLEIRQP